MHIQVAPDFRTQFIPENMYESQNAQKSSNGLVCYNGGSVTIA